MCNTIYSRGRIHCNWKLLCSKLMDQTTTKWFWSKSFSNSLILWQHSRTKHIEIRHH